MQASSQGCKYLIMQIFSGKIKSEMVSVISTFPSLTQSTKKELIMSKKIIPSDPNTIKTCSVQDCQHPIRTYKSGLCGKHLSRFSKHGSVILPRDSIEGVFWRSVLPDQDPNECWEWRGSLVWGYGQMTWNGKNYRAHRVSFYIHNGDWAKDCVLHSCDNPKCVNPKHLRNGTNKENTADAMARNRMAKGEKHHNSVLKEAEVIEIKKQIAAGVSGKSLAARFNVLKTTISSIKTGRLWKHVKI